MDNKISGEEAKNQIKKLFFDFEQLENNKVDSFILSQASIKLTEDIKRIQDLCTHKYRNKICIFCNKKKE